MFNGDFSWWYPEKKSGSHRHKTDHLGWFLQPISGDLGDGVWLSLWDYHALPTNSGVRTSFDMFYMFLSELGVIILKNWTWCFSWGSCFGRIQTKHRFWRFLNHPFWGEVFNGSEIFPEDLVFARTSPIFRGTLRKNIDLRVDLRAQHPKIHPNTRNAIGICSEKVRGLIFNINFILNYLCSKEKLLSFTIYFTATVVCPFSDHFGKKYGTFQRERYHHPNLLPHSWLSRYFQLECQWKF